MKTAMLFLMTSSVFFPACAGLYYFYHPFRLVPEETLRKNSNMWCSHRLLFRIPPSFLLVAAYPAIRVCTDSPVMRGKSVAGLARGRSRD
jgi:hypothetical protein